MLIKTILDFIFPPHPACRLCGSPLESNISICAACQDKITACEGSFCTICGRYWPLSAEVKPAICHECSERRPSFAAARSVGIYGGVLRDAVYLYKYQGCRSLSEEFGVMLADVFLREPILPRATAIVPVPLSSDKMKLRGFNQSQLLAGKLSSVLGIPVRNYLQKSINTPSQSKLTREARIDSVRGVFRLNHSPACEQIILVDDIFTTGATAGECSRVLLEGGADKVAVLTLASGRLEKSLRGVM